MSIYSVDPRGLTSLGDERSRSRAGSPTIRATAQHQSFQDELRTAQDSLRTLSEDTGGYAAVNTNDFTQGVRPRRQDNSGYYVLGYLPDRTIAATAGIRKIEVKVKRPGPRRPRPQGLQRAKGQAARTGAHGHRGEGVTRGARGDQQPRCRCLACGSKAYAAPFKGAAPNASIAVGIEASGSDLAFQPKDGKFVNDVELSVVAIDTNGKIKDGDRTLLNMGSEARHPCQGRTGRPAYADTSQSAARPLPGALCRA